MKYNFENIDGTINNNKLEFYLEKTLSYKDNIMITSFNSYLRKIKNNKFIKLPLFHKSIILQKTSFILFYINNKLDINICDIDGNNILNYLFICINKKSNNNLNYVYNLFNLKYIDIYYLSHSYKKIKFILKNNKYLKNDTSFIKNLMFSALLINNNCNIENYNNENISPWNICPRIFYYTDKLKYLREKNFNIFLKENNNCNHLIFNENYNNLIKNYI